MTDSTGSEAPRIEASGDGSGVRLGGHWVTQNLAQVERMAQAVRPAAGGSLRVDASGIERLDTSGARVLDRLLAEWGAGGGPVRQQGLRPELAELLDFVHERWGDVRSIPVPRRPGFIERVGRLVVGRLDAALDLLAFSGETCLGMLRNLRQPQKIRWSTFFKIIQRTGADALPIIGLLSFLLGIVIAYQGGAQLKLYGANIFIVELVTITFIRELSPLMAAIIVAGRTGSAFTAEIGTMKVTEEVDALTSMGIRPMDVLVLPKVFGLMVALPLVTVWSSALGVFGGMVMANVLLDVSFFDFATRIPRTVGVSSFIIGIGKAPVFAAIIAMVGCYQGFQVSGGAESVGQRTTTSVVQGIFLVIVADAAFSILFSLVGV